MTNTVKQREPVTLRFFRLTASLIQILFNGYGIAKFHFFWLPIDCPFNRQLDGDQVNPSPVTMQKKNETKQKTKKCRGK